jgi:hypothetical protein
MRSLFSNRKAFTLLMAVVQLILLVLPARAVIRDGSFQFIDDASTNNFLRYYRSRVSP